MIRRVRLSCLVLAGLLVLVGCEDTTKLREATTLRKGQRYEQAIEKYKEFLQEFPESPRKEQVGAEIAETYYQLGEQNAKVKKFADAIEDMETIIEEYRDSPRRADASVRVQGYYVAQADKLLKDDQYADAARLLQNTIQKYPGSAASRDAELKLAEIGKIAFVSGGNVWVANADGSQARQVVELAIDPDLAPDGVRLALIKTGTRSEDKGVLTVVGIDGSGPNVLLKSPIAYRPHWSPEGNEIVVTKLGTVRDMDGRMVERKLFQIVEIDSDSEPKNIWGVKGLDTIGDYSPAGDHFVGFQQRQVDGTYRLTVVNKKFEGYILASFDEDPVRCATFTPDGRMVVFARAEGLFLINPNGQEMRPLLESKDFGNMDIQYLDVSPGGRHIILLAKAESDPHYRFYVASLSKEIKPIQITTPEGTEVIPDIGTVSWAKGWMS